MIKTILWMVFFCFSISAFGGVVLDVDTIIINGATVNVRVEESLKDSEKSIETSTDSLPEKVLIKSLGIDLNQGVSFNSVKGSQDWTSLDDFVENSPVRGSFSSVSINSLIHEKRSRRIFLGLGYTSWSQEYLRMDDEVSDSLFTYYSPGDKEFCQVTRIRTFGGKECDTLSLNLTTENYSQSYFEVMFESKWNLLNPKKKSMFEVSLGVIPGVLIRESKSQISVLQDDILLVSSTQDLKKNTLNLSIQSTISFEKKIKGPTGVFAHAGIRRNISNIFSSDNLLTVRRNSLFLGLGLNFYFH